MINFFGWRLERRIQDYASVAGDANQEGKQEEEDMGAQSHKFQNVSSPDLVL